MQVTKWLSVTAILGVAILIVVIYEWDHRERVADNQSEATVRTTTTQSEAKPLPAPFTPVLQPVHRSKLTSETANVAPEVSYRQRFARAHDYFAFAHSILNAARAGDPDAAYFLWNMSFTCAQAPVAKFTTLDEAERYGASLRMPMETVHKIYERCHKLRTQNVSDLGDSWDWLNRAVKGGQPVAQATAASFQILQDRMKVAGISSNWLAQAPIGRDTDPKTLVLEALKSGDPDALLQIGTMTHLLNPRESHQQSSIDKWAWTIVACQRGASCTECGQDCDITSMMTLAGNAWGTVQLRAQEISDKLDAEQWDDLGLGLSTSDATASSSP